MGFWVFKAGGVTLYFPSFPRGGLAAIFTATTLAMLGSPSLLITVEHKNQDDTSFALLGAFSSITTLNNFTKDLSGIKEEVRFTFTVSATNDWEGFNVLMTAPAWRPYA